MFGDVGTIDSFIPFIPPHMRSFFPLSVFQEKFQPSYDCTVLTEVSASSYHLISVHVRYARSVLSVGV